MPVGLAIVVALVIASFKGSLVASVFMHLSPRAQGHLLGAAGDGDLLCTC